MKNILIYVCMTIFFLSACNDGLDIKQDYDFSITTLPVPKKLKTGESTPIEFSIIREGIYTEAEYHFRYFQSDGKGKLTGDKEKVFSINRYYPVKDRFTLYYQSDCKESQTLDFVFRDNFNREKHYTLSFQPDNGVD